MIKKLFTLSFSIFVGTVALAQEHNHIKCAADIVLQQQLEDPEVRARYEAFKEAARRYAQNPNNPTVRNEQGIRIIPTVFHILHAGGTENVPRSKVETQLKVLNEDFQRLNPDTVNLPERFLGDTEYTSFVFTADALENFIDDSAYAVLHNRYDETYIFHFNNGSEALSDSLLDDFQESYGSFNVVEVEVPVNPDTTALASALADSINAQNGLTAQMVRDTTVLQAPNFLVDGSEQDSLNYTSVRSFETVLNDLAPTFTVDGSEVDTLRYSFDRTFETSFVNAAPSFLVDGATQDTLFYTTEHTFTTSWNGSEVDTTFSDTLIVELFEDEESPLLPTDTLEVFPSDIVFDIFDGVGAVTGTGSFVTEDTLLLTYSIVVDTIFSDTLMVELFEDELTPFEATDTLDVFDADLMYATFDENGDTVSLNSFIAVDTLVLDYYAQIDTVYSDTLMVELFQNQQNPFEPTDTLYVFNSDVSYVAYADNGDTLSVETFAAEGNLELEFTEVVIIDGDHRVNVATDGYGYIDDVLLAKLWSITSTIEQQGSYIPADSRIEFRLATLDPLGNCTDGIVRVFTSKTNGANNGTGFKAESYWDCRKYLNVWVVDDIDFDTGQGTTLGYAQFPGTGLCSTDGIVVIASNIDERFSGGRTATHEVGHWLDLRHIWGDATCGSDDVFDTPTHEEPNFGVCGNGPNNPQGQGGSGQYHEVPYNPNSLCSADQPDGEMFMNYMDYSPDNCMNMFTLGQKARMDFVLHGDGEEPGYRELLISQGNLEETGVADPYTPGDCDPVSDFYFDQGSDFATQQMICVGGEVDFEESAYNSLVDEYSWTFEGGDPDASTNANPSDILYDNPGKFDVSLEVTNASGGSDTKTVVDMVIVSSLDAEYASDWGYVDNFWNEDDFLEDYIVFNQDGTANKWEWYQGSNGGFTGSESVRMFNYNNLGAEIDELISPSYDLSELDSPTIQFRYTGASVDNTPEDQLRIMVSRNCGESWSSRRTISGVDLTTAGIVEDGYVPTSLTNWRDVEIDLGSFANRPNVRVKFRWVSGGRSNNFYIDDFTISGSPIGMEDLEQQIGLNIAPNPTSDMTAVTMNLYEPSRVRMEFIDILGKEVVPVLSRDMTSGGHRFDVDMSSFATGIYYLRIFVGNDLIVKKVVKG